MKVHLSADRIEPQGGWTGAHPECLQHRFSAVREAAAIGIREEGAGMAANATIAIRGGYFDGN
jgi:hypothetical protein